MSAEMLNLLLQIMLDIICSKTKNTNPYVLLLERDIVFVVIKASYSSEVL